jgi:hypothetical protein
MEEFVNVVCMCVLSMAGGGRALRMFDDKKNKLYAFILCSYLQFWILNCLRIIIFQYDNILLYRDNIILCFCDIILLFIGWSGILCELCKNVIGKKITLILTTFIFIYYMALFVSGILKYRNFNASIYGMLYPKQHFICGFIVLLVCMVFNKITEKTAVSKSYMGMKWMVIAAFVVTTVIYPTWEVYASNVSEFTFTLGEAGIYIISYFVAVVLITGIMEKLLGKRLGCYLIIGLWIITVCSYIQGMFLNGKLFLMDGKELDWGIGVIIPNMAIWIIMISVLAWVIKKFITSREKIILYSSGILVILQLAGAASLVVNYINSTESEYSVEDYLSTDGLYEVSPNDNIIVFVLDTYDVDYLNLVLEKYPDFLSPLKGFTYFTDTVSQFSRTFPSITYMLTGEEYFYEIPRDEYVQEAFSVVGSEFWNGLNNNNFDYYIYEDEETIIGRDARQNAVNYVAKGHQTDVRISFTGCIESISRIAGYRNLPYALKKYYNYTSGTVDDLVIQERILDEPLFEAKDSSIYADLRTYGLCVSDTDKNAFRFIHLNGAHEPYTMDENGNKVDAYNSSAIDQYVGSMRLVFDYLDYLRQIGMYDSSTIVITADHGENYVTPLLTQNTNPILFIKLKDAGGSDMEISNVYASQNDIIPTISAVYNIGCDENMGLDLFDTKGLDRTRTRIHYFTVVENTKQTKTLTYEIIGSSLDFNNWHSTGEYHMFGKYY